MSRINLLWMPGGGGCWLMHVIYCLQSDDVPVLHSRGESYDYDVRTEDVINEHHINRFDTQDNVILISTKNLFNIGINNLAKNPDGTHELTTTEIFDKFTNDALYQMNKNEYNTNIILDHDWIYNDTDRFMHEFYSVLDKHEIQYKKNDSTVKQAIKNYIKTNTLVSDYYENYSSCFWLGWCHAVLMLSDTCINEDLSNCSVNEIGEILKPFNTECVSEIRKFIIPGTLDVG